MKRISLLAALIFLAAFSNAQDLYAVPLKTIDGKTIDLTTFKGGKILFLILPLSDGDTTLNSLALFQQKYGDKVQTIGIPAMEEGFKKGDEMKLKRLYQDKNINLLIAEAMEVKKSSGSQQSPIMQWLTNKDNNRHFNMDVKGIGQKFFVDETGKLYAVIGPEFSLNAPVIDRVVNKPLAIKK